jgi:hypothetical protein
MLPVDVTKSEWMCTLETVVSDQWSVASEYTAADSWRKEYRRYAWACVTFVACAKKALRRWCASAGLLRSLLFTISLGRVPELRKDELTTLAEIGALKIEI